MSAACQKQKSESDSI